MGEHDRSWHQFGRFVAGVAEHQSLVASALFRGFFAFGFFGIDSLGDVGRLGSDDVLHENLVGMKDIVVVHVADFPHGIADDLDVIEFGFSGDFSADDGDVAFHVGFASDPTGGILSEAGIQHGIRNGVGHFVGMAFANGLG